MVKSLFKQIGGTYHEENRYLIPNLKLPTEEEHPIGTWGQWHLDYLKQFHKFTYTTLLTGSRLNTYLSNVDKKPQGIMKYLKEEKILEWTEQLNNIRACARKIVNDEMICI